MSVKPFRVSVGRNNIRASDNSSGAFLGRMARKGFDEVQNNFNAFCDHLEGQMPEILKEAMEPTFEKSKEYCPKDTHDLVNSAYMEVEKFRGGSRLEMGYGRDGKPSYSIFVHEMPYSHEPPTRSKWLEAALDEDYYQILQRLSDIVKYGSGI